MNSVVKAKDVTPRNSTNYPPHYADVVKGRFKAAVSDKFDLTQFGISFTRLEPGAWSSQRHWHEHEDEFVFVLEGSVTLIDDHGRHALSPGMCAGFKAGVANGHHLVNEGKEPAFILEVGTRSPVEVATYPDVDMAAEKNNGKYLMTRKDGSPF
jgi:uncharacterized cupin superfamily protein